MQRFLQLRGVHLAAILFLQASIAVGQQVPYREINCQTLGLTVPKPDQPIEFPLAGFSVVPPPGGMWCQGGLTQYGVTFFSYANLGHRVVAKPSDATLAHTFFIKVGVVDVKGRKIETPEDLKSFATWFWSSDGRFKTRDIETTIENRWGTTCARTKVVQEERNNPRFPARTLILKVQPDFLCVHLRSPFPSVVDIGVSERYLDGVMTGQSFLETHRDEVAQFLENVRFSLPSSDRRAN